MVKRYREKLDQTSPVLRWFSGIPDGVYRQRAVSAQAHAQESRIGLESKAFFASRPRGAGPQPVGVEIRRGPSRLGVGPDSVHSRRMSRFPYPAYPNGWFRVAYSAELSVGEVKAVRFFGRELVVFRGEDGAARVFDAFCPHLGAHLGHGGRVEGEGLRCPFHAWLFDGEGQCVEVPYAKRIPRRASVGTWPVAERNGIVFVPHHAKQEAPAYEIPVLDECGHAAWSEPESRFWKVRSRWLDMNENAVDNIHFKYVHGVPDYPTATIEVDGPVFRVDNQMRMTTPRGEIESTLTTIDHGPGFQIVRISGAIDTLMLNTATPIDETHTDVSFSYSVKHDGDEKKQRVGAARIRDLEHQFEQDLPIWENKTYWEKPMLTAEDGDFGSYRRWIKQFFSESWE